MMEKIFYVLMFLLFSFGLTAQTDLASSNKIHKVVEQLPYFDTGNCNLLKDQRKKMTCAEAAMYDFIYANLEYPEAARRDQLEGVVILQFVVEKDGSLSDFEIIKDIGKGCGRAALDAVEQIEKFHPARLNAYPVRVRHRLSVTFDLTK